MPIDEAGGEVEMRDVGDEGGRGKGGRGKGGGGGGGEGEMKMEVDGIK